MDLEGARGIDNINKHLEQSKKKHPSKFWDDISIKNKNRSDPDIKNKKQGPDTLHAARARKQELARTSLREQEIGATLRPAARPLTAASRREAVERRVRAKLALQGPSKAVPDKE